MKNKNWIIVIFLISVLLCMNVLVQKKYIKTYMITELEYRGYSVQDVQGIEIKHSYLNRLLSYDEWSISVEFKRQPDIIFLFTYRDNSIIFQGVSSNPLLDKDDILDYLEKYKNGTLLK